MRRVASVIGIGLAVALGGCTSSAEPDPVDPVDIAAGSDVESVLLAETMAALLRADGMAARVESFDDLGAARRALEFGVVDALPGYTGAAWLDVLGRPDPPSDPRASFGQVRQFDLRNGIEWLTPTFSDTGGIDAPPADATFALFVRAAPLVTVRPAVVEGEPGAGGERDGDTAGATVPDPAAAAGGLVVPVVVERVSQLASLLADAPAAALCLDPDFIERDDGAVAMFDAYAINPARPLVAAGPDLAPAAVAAGECVAGLSTTTDGRAWAEHLRPLADDRGLFPSFVVAIQARAELREERPEVLGAWEPVRSQLTTRLLGQHNARVVAGEPVETVAVDLAATLSTRADPS